MRKQINESAELQKIFETYGKLPKSELETRYYMNGIYACKTDSALEYVRCDGKILLLLQRPLDKPWIYPLGLSRKDSNYKLAIDPDAAGTYPQYHRVIPDNKITNPRGSDKMWHIADIDHVLYTESYNFLDPVYREMLTKCLELFGAGLVEVHHKPMSCVMVKFDIPHLGMLSVIVMPKVIE